MGNASLNIHSEIGLLKTVLVHKPGDELQNIDPSSLDRLLFDDIPYLDVAKSEHDVFAQMLRNEGVDVVYLEDLVVEALDADKAAKDAFIQEYVAEAHVAGKLLPEKLSCYLKSFEDNRELVSTAMAGIRTTQIEPYSQQQAQTLTDVTSLEAALLRPLLVDPIPNLYFTRDSFSVIGQGVSINKMWASTRKREQVFAHSIFNYHPTYSTAPLWFDNEPNTSIEGGDILVLSPTCVCIGVSERTNAQAVDMLAKRLLYANEERFDRVLAFLIPHTRAFMHLDTVFTMVDVDTFTVHPNVLDEIKVFELKRSSQGVCISQMDGSLDKILARVLGLPAVRLIKCGGDDPIASAREQWNDGSNTLAVRPGRIFVYQRNKVTNEILYKEGLELLEIPSAELLRGRGGPHCMSMAFVREELS